jgi:hypothetical protein
MTEINTSQPSEIILFITGKENSSFISSKQQRHLVMLATASVLVSLLFATSASVWVYLHSNNSFLLVGTWVFSFIIYTMLNRAYFLFSSGTHQKGKLKFILVYIILYSISAYLIVCDVFCFYLLEEKMVLLQNIDSPLERFSAMQTVTEVLQPNQQKAYRQYQFSILAIVFIISLIPLLIQSLLIQQDAFNSPEMKSDELRQQIVAELEAKKREYTQLFNAVESDGVFQEDFLSGEDRKKKAEELLNQINHLKHSLQDIL